MQLFQAALECHSLFVVVSIEMLAPQGVLTGSSLSCEKNDYTNSDNDKVNKNIFAIVSLLLNGTFCWNIGCNSCK